MSSSRFRHLKSQYVFIIAAIVIVASVMGMSVFFLNSIEQRLRADAEYYIKTITEQVAENIGDKIFTMRAFVKAFTLESTDPEEIQYALKMLQGTMGYPIVGFEGVDGVGFLADGTPFTNESFGFPNQNPSGDDIASTTVFVTPVNKLMRVMEGNLFIDGEKIGTIYVAVYPGTIISENELARVSTEGYFILLDSFSESVFLPLSEPTTELIYRDPELKNFLNDRQLQGSLLGDQEGVTIQEGAQQPYEYSSQTVLYRATVDGVPSYICIAPTGSTNWYLCSVIPEKNLRADTLGIAVAFQTAFVGVMLGLLTLLLVGFLLYRKYSQNKAIRYRTYLFDALTNSLDMSIYLYFCKTSKIMPIVAKSREMFGYSFEDFMGDEAIAKNLKASQEGLELFDKIRAKTITSPQEGEFSMQDDRINQTKWIFYSVIPVAFDTEDRYLIVFRDVTTEKNLQLSMKDAMVAAEVANKAKSEFLSRMSHEIRTPMNAIIGMTVIALKNLNNKQKMKESLERIITASDHLLNITNEFLDISKIESGKIAMVHEPFNLVELVNDVSSVINMQCEQKDQKFTLVIGEISEEILVGDRIRLQQVLFNLLTNAIKYTPSKGNIRFEVYEEPSVVARYMSITFMITDDGIGMTPEFQEHLFEPFAMEGRSPEGGTGLGLSIAKNIVTMFNGSIQVESEPDKGTTWCVNLNLERYQELDAQKQEVRSFNTTSEIDRNVFGSQRIRAYGAGRGPRKRLAKTVGFSQVTSDEVSQVTEAYEEKSTEGLRILLVEDNELNAEIAQELLEDRGLSVDWAHDGQQACEMFVGSEIGYYDAVLMDIQMPIMGGYEATRRIRSSERDDASTIPIIAMSANAFMEDVNASFENGMDEHLSKPIDVSQIIETIKKHL